ncbi:MAG: tetratricopeptide repeat protein [Candidatus Obscuribacterales bacterium]|nr:tetratricopeptide repeat protein [Candidatus Obscuribacterales bacterium]
MTEKDFAEIRQELQIQAAKQNEILERLKTNDVALKRKDHWDILAAITPLISSCIIALCGAYFTVSYNQQQLKLQEIQTIEKFIPHLMGDERSKRAAILSISSLTDARLAAKVAAIYASEGTVSALESIAEQGNSGDRKIASGALPKALDNMAENYRVERRYEDAIKTYKKSLALRQEIYGNQSPRLVPSLSRLANFYISHGEFAEAEGLLQKVISIQQTSYGGDSPQVVSALRDLAELYRGQGALGKAESVLNQAIAIEQNLPATDRSGKAQVADNVRDDNGRGQAVGGGGEEEVELKPEPPAVQPKAEQNVSGKTNGDDNVAAAAEPPVSNTENHL